MAKAKKRAGKKSELKKGAAKKREKKEKKSKKDKKAARAAPKKKTPSRKPASGLEALAKKIVRLSQKPHFGPEEIRALYQPDAVSVEANGGTAVGHAALEEKMKAFEQMAASMVSKPVHVWTGPDTICIEWDFTITTHDGRTLPLRETAVHEIKDGKIQRERYYYDPAVLAPPQ